MAVARIHDAMAALPPSAPARRLFEQLTAAQLRLHKESADQRAAHVRAAALDGSSRGAHVLLLQVRRRSRRAHHAEHANVGSPIAR